ncbi:effector-associated constant component EACC1 [Actinoplanes subglobosus]|uniref:Uncharacterized protein n=1 Tax=Actinoplanes subglobosus TaxID=1547892 RepID=A0ABV8J1Y2_9ACTN
MTDVVVTATTPDGSRHQEVLGEWLRAEDALRGRVRNSMQPQTQESMGALSDGIIVAIGSGGILTALVTSLVNWLTRDKSTASEVNRPIITVTLPDGMVIRIDSQGALNPSEVAAAVESIDRRAEE